MSRLYAFLFYLNNLAILLLLSITIATTEALSSNNPENKDHNKKSSIKIEADDIVFNNELSTITATGKAEITYNIGKLYSDKIIFNQNTKIITAQDNILLKNVEIGNLFAKNIRINNSFQKGDFENIQMILNNGSYISSQKGQKINKNLLLLESGFFSICPNPAIDNSKRIESKEKDFITISAKKLLVNQLKSTAKFDNVVIKIYDTPLLYLPKLTIPLPPNKKTSGFLTPSYLRNSRFGLGFNVPYYFNLAKNYDLTTSPIFYPFGNQLILNNEFRHFTNYGLYKINGEVANNKVKDNNDLTVITRTNSQIRWNIASSGNFQFTKNTALDFNIKELSDANYLRDYYFNYLNYNTSYFNIDNIKDNEYHSAKLVRIQELENFDNQNSLGNYNVLPIVKSYFERHGLLLNRETLSLETTYANLSNKYQDYQHLSLTPKLELPANIYGNIFNFSGKIQGDVYQQSVDKGQNQQYQNYRPESSIYWHLPLVKNHKGSTIRIEPMASILSSSSKKDLSSLPNQDSINSELTVNNLFVNDRVYGLDRNEVGQRINYALRSSVFHNSHQYRITLGQAIRKNNNNQDILIRGFNASTSNIIGETYYKNSLFDINYNFQLNESNYKNDINELIINSQLKNLTFNATYLKIDQNNNNSFRANQASVNSNVKISKKINIGFIIRRDMDIGRNINRGISINYSGCCVESGIAINQNHQSSLLKPQTSINFSIAIKNL